MILLTALTVSCVYGSIVSSDANRGIDYALVYVFNTWWFLTLMGLLALNLVVCTWRRFWGLFRFSRRACFKTDKASFLRSAQQSLVLEWPAASHEQLLLALRSRFRFVRQQGNAFYARKGHVGRYGATIVHAGLLWVMAAGFARIVADDWGWGIYDAHVAIAEGETADEYFTRIDRLKPPAAQNLQPAKLPFALRLLDFRAEYYPQSSVPKYFASLVELRDGQDSQIHEISMTAPLVYKGYKITQNSYSVDPQVQRGQFRVVDTRRGISEEVDASVGNPVRLHFPPNNDLFLSVKGYAPGQEFSIADLAASKQLAQGLIEQESSPTSSPLAATQRSGYRVYSLGASDGYVSYLGLMRDPTSPWIFSGCLIVILGTMLAFGVSQREVWALISPQEGKLYLAWSVKGSAPLWRKEFDQLVEQLSKQAGSSSTTEDRMKVSPNS